MPQNPVLFVDPTSYDYHTAQQLAAYIGTSQQGSIDIEDHGQNPMSNVTVTLTDSNGVFTLVQPCPGGLTDNDAGSKTTVGPYPDSAFASFYFKPTAAQEYDATITISSNATLIATDGGGTQSGSAIVIPIVALGVDPGDAG